MKSKLISFLPYFDLSDLFLLQNNIAVIIVATMNKIITVATNENSGAVGEGRGEEDGVGEGEETAGEVIGSSTSVGVGVGVGVGESVGLFDAEDVAAVVELLDCGLKQISVGDIAQPTYSTMFPKPEGCVWVKPPGSDTLALTYNASPGVQSQFGYAKVP